jgi:hypothetical protein
VSLNVSQWAGTKKDKRETAALAAKHNLPAEAARVNKTLLPMAAPLERIHKQTGALRTYYYDHTVPWEYSRNALKAEAYIDFATTMRGMIADWWQAVDAFDRAYPSLLANAKQTLNGMFNPDDYPDPSVMRSKFNIELRFTPVAEAGHLVLDASTEAEREAERELREELQRGMDSRLEEAMRDVFKRVYDTAKHAHERLADPRKVFHDSMVENAVKLVSILPSLNVANDPVLTQLTRDLETSLCAHTPEVLKQPGVTRTQTAARMKDIMDKMGAFYTPVGA